MHTCTLPSRQSGSEWAEIGRFPMFLATAFCGGRQHGGCGACRDWVPVCHDDAAAGLGGLALCRRRKIGLISGGSLGGFIQPARYGIAIHQSVSHIAKCSLCLAVVLILACRSQVHLSDLTKYACTTIKFRRLSWSMTRSWSETIPGSLQSGATYV
jgi:hypothetical protein